MKVLLENLALSEGQRRLLQKGMPELRVPHRPSQGSPDLHFKEAHISPIVDRHAQGALNF